MPSCRNSKNVSFRETFSVFCCEIIRKLFDRALKCRIHGENWILRFYFDLRYGYCKQGVSNSNPNFFRKLFILLRKLNLTCLITCFSHFYKKITTKYILEKKLITKPFFLRKKLNSRPRQNKTSFIYNILKILKNKTNSKHANNLNS